MSPPESPITLLDICAVVNLYATGWMKQILAAIDGPVAITNVVEREAQYVFRGGSGEDAKERELVDLRPLIAAGALAVLAATAEDELLTFIDLTQEVGQGEAMTAALAIHRGGIVITDDRKATWILTSRGVTVRTTLDLINSWAERKAITPAVLRRVLLDVRQRGSYEPSRRHPLREWWEIAAGPP